MNDNLASVESAWYREFYVWLVILLPACAVVASFATLYIAAKNPPEMAVADYSNIESIAADQQARDRRAAELGMSAQLEFSGTRVTAIVRSDDLATLPQALILRVRHSTTSQFDQLAKLTGNQGIYTGVVTLPSGAYDVHLEDSDRTWRLSTRVVGQPDAIVLEAYRQDN